MRTDAESNEPIKLSYAPPSLWENARSYRNHPLWSAANFLVMAAIVWFAYGQGLYLRRVAWEMATQVHFRITMNSAIKWGQEANRDGMLKVYQKTLTDEGDDPSQEPGDGRLALDYPPLRLFAIAKWEAWTEEFHPGEKWSEPAAQRARLRQHDRNPRSALWLNDYGFTRPMLELNTACEAAGAIAMFLLVHYWLRQCSGAPSKQWIEPLRCAWPALLSALLVWFSPAAIFDGHSYPQWDSWILPPFLLAVYFGMLDLWLISGICIGIVSMGKGQILMVVPALIVWQLLMFRPGAVYRLSIGIILAIGLVASPWLVSGTLATTWMMCVVIALVWMIALFFLRDSSITSAAASVAILLVAAVLILWPLHSMLAMQYADDALLAVIALAVAARFLPGRYAFAWAATAIAGALFACYLIFDTSMDWYTIGIKFPTEHWQLLYWCHAMNLGAILSEDFHWKFAETLYLADYIPWLFTGGAFEVRNNITLVLLTPTLCCAGVAWLLRTEKAFRYWPIAATSLAILLASFILVPWLQVRMVLLVDDEIIPMRYLMITAYFISICLCGIGMAMHNRRKDRMFFFAMVAPWVLMFTLLPQMQNRYTMWGAVFAAATASFSLDGFMLYLFMNALSVVDIAWDMCFRAQGTKTAEKWLQYTGRDSYTGEPTFGGIGPFFPHLGYAVLVVAGIYLYLSLRRDRRPPLMLPSLIKYDRGPAHAPLLRETPPALPAVVAVAI